MGLQTKILSLFFVIAATMIGFFSWFYFNSLTPTIQAIDQQKTTNKSVIPQVFFEQEKNELAQLTRSIGLSFSLLKNSNTQITENFTSTLKTLEADWIFLMSEDKSPVFSLLTNPLFSKSSVTALVQQLQKDYPLLLNKITSEPQSLLVLTAEGPALLGVLKIPFTTTEATETANLLVCRFIDAPLQNKLEKLLPQTKILPLTHAPLSGKQNKLLERFSDYSDSYSINEADTQKWRSYTALKDISGKPQVLLQTIQAKSLNEVMLNSYILSISFALSLLVILLIGLNILLNKNIYKPLYQVLAQLSTWVEKTKIKGDLEVKGKHEFESLTHLINQVIRVINYHQSTALSHAFNEGANEMRDSFIKEIKRLTKPLLSNLSDLETTMTETTLNNLETTLTNMLGQISNLDVRTTFLTELKHRCNQIRLMQKTHLAKINDSKNKCSHLSTLLQAHTLNFEQAKHTNPKIKSQRA